LRQWPAVEGHRTVWSMQDVGASTTTVDRSNAKLLDVYRVTNMRSNEKLLDYVLAQQQAQGVHRSCELKGQPVEMDTVSINATFPDLRGCLDLIINNQIISSVSQESKGSGATLGESLRSLNVEIRSADGQDDGGERQGPRRSNASLGYTSDEPRDGVAGFASIDTAFLDALLEKLLAEVLSG
nr:hypothetical protein [Tanacetum cinerariifolium]